MIFLIFLYVESTKWKKGSTVQKLQKVIGMPSADQHSEKYLHNKKLLSIAGFRSGFADWFITALFYGAVHLVECELEKHGHHSKDHSDRRNWVAKWPAFEGIRAEYTLLDNQSRRARYKCVKLLETDVKDAEEYFEKIEAHLTTEP